MHDITEDVKDVLKQLSVEDWCEDSAGSSSEGPYWVGKLSLEKETDMDDIQNAIVISRETLGIEITVEEIVGFWVMTETLDGDFVVHRFETKEKMDHDFAMKSGGVRRIEEILGNL